MELDSSTNRKSQLHAGSALSVDFIADDSEGIDNSIWGSNKTKKYSTNSKKTSFQAKKEYMERQNYTEERVCIAVLLLSAMVKDNDEKFSI